jgi:uncharacterized protein (TIGR02678 family)
MSYNAYLESDDEQPEDVDVQAPIRAGITSTIHVPSPTLLQAHRALLEKPFISSNDEAYFWIKTHYHELKEWHRKQTGWYIKHRNDLYRLQRQPSILTSGYGGSKPLLQNPRDFVYVVWILWYATNDQIAKRGSGQLFLLPQMLGRLSDQWRLEKCIDVLTLGETVDFPGQSSIMSNRRSMARALKYLQGLGCLKELDGQIDDWIEQDGPVLYQFTNTIHLLVMSLDLDALHAVIEHQKTATIFTPAVLAIGKEKNQNALTRAWRTLLLSPFLLKFDDPEAFMALTQQVDSIRQEVENTFDWLLEINHDYACLIKDQFAPSSSPSRLLNPKKNTSDQMVLFFCGELRNQVAAGMLRPNYFGCIPTTFSYLLDLFVVMRGKLEQYWGRGAYDKSSKDLLTEILKKMCHIGLIRGPEGDDVLILPTAARYQPRYVEYSADGPPSGEKQEEQTDFQQANLWADKEETSEE